MGLRRKLKKHLRPKLMMWKMALSFSEGLGLGAPPADGCSYNDEQEGEFC